MSIARSLLPSVMLIATLAASVSTRAAAETPAPEIWVTASARPIKEFEHWRGIRTDAFDQWSPVAAWPTVAARTGVAKLIAGNIENTRDADLRATVEEIKRRHLALALEIGPLVRSADCAPATEAYGNHGETEAILEKIRNAGGDLRYVAMDEPFFYGHLDPGGCKPSAVQLAQQVAASVASMRRIFPRLQVGDIEVTNTNRAGIDEIAQWADAYRVATGEPLAFLHADVAWSELAIRNLAPLAAELKARHIPFGIIYNADADVTSDTEWTESAVRHFVEIESILNIHPDAAIFQTWTRYPTRVLPESQPGTLMNVPFQYLHPAPSLRLTRSGKAVAGILTGSDGKPIAGAAVTLTAVDTRARIWPTDRRLSGTVPDGAATAVIGIRVGLEGACVCAGPTGAIVGGIHYNEQGRPPQDVSPVSVPIEGAPMSLRTLALVPGKTYAPNLRQFSVTAGATYTFDAWIAATDTAEDAGYVTVVFLDSAGKGLLRRNLWLRPSIVPLGRQTTDAHGAFSLALPDEVASAPAEIRAEFAGSPALRPSLAVVPLPSGPATLPALERTNPTGAAPLTILGPHAAELGALFADTLPAKRQQWDRVAPQIQAVRLTAGAIMALPDATLARIAEDLSARHIALGLEVLATNWYHEPACGGGVEGFIDPGAVNQVVAKLLKARATVDFIAMDEPLWYGHFYSGRNACHNPIQDLARRVAVIVRIYTAAFPNLAVGDIEPFPAVSSQPGWQEAYASWVRAFQAESGTPLSFLHLDFDWAHPQLNGGPAHSIANPEAIAALARQAADVAQRNHLLVGMIMNGGGPPTARSDAEWIEQAHRHIQALESSGIHFDHVLLETWDKYPARTFPDTDPNTLSGLVAFYRRTVH